MLERVKRGFTLQFFDEDGKAKTPLVFFQHLDRLLSDKGKLFRDLIKDRNMFVELVMMLQRVGATLEVSIGGRK